jgi:hypothetical protein
MMITTTVTTMIMRDIMVSIGITVVMMTTKRAILCIQKVKNFDTDLNNRNDDNDSGILEVQRDGH